MASVLHSRIELLILAMLICCSLQEGSVSSAAAAPAPTCPVGYMSCGYNHRNRCLTYVKSDVNNCGYCGLKCSSCAHSTPNCYDSKCGFDCVQGWKNCDGTGLNGCETPVEWDVKNCGDCGKRCPHYWNTVSPLCSGGACTGVCMKGWKDCNNNLALDGCEALLSSDKKNCGACNVQCGPAANAAGICLGSKCGLQCYTGFANCDRKSENGCEVALQTDVKNCGACGKQCDCPPHAFSTCSGGSCGYKCNDGFKDCNGVWVDGCEVTPATDVKNCGACGKKCDCPPNAWPTCAGGKCGYACKDGFKDCNGLAADGCEMAITKFQTDVLNCGSCGMKCNSPPNAWPTCAVGKCGFACKDGFKDCNGLAADGCEVAVTNFQTDVLNCGSCGKVCASSPNALQTCAGGSCVSGCKDGFVDCNGKAEDGCEQDVTTDIYNCGGCDLGCSLANAQPVCSSGACDIKSCNDGFSDCNSDNRDGCEVDVQSDTANCGKCGQECSFPNVFESQCSSGVCEIKVCDEGFKDCNGVLADGCEVNSLTDVENCGDCGQGCSFPNVFESQCSSGVCEIKVCDEGFRDCNGVLADGCEVKCGIPNVFESQCSSGGCEIKVCDEGFKDCNGVVADGCEVNSLTDVENCGDCGQGCSFPNVFESQCSSGVCEIKVCDEGFKDCNGVLADGCEVNSQTDMENCGDCGQECSFPNVYFSTCSGGGCEITVCNEGFKDCNGVLADGCEARTDVENCD